VTDIAESQRKLLEVLHRFKVDFVLIGGVGAQAHGWRGATLDVDIAVSIDDDNVVRLNQALQTVRAGEGRIGALGTTFETIYGRLEIIRRADGVGAYADWLENASPRDLGDGLTIVVASPEDILRSKEASGRAKDLAVLEQMRADFRDNTYE
jgi:hypothetical protein